MVAAAADIISRLVAASFQFEHVLFGSSADVVDVVSMSTATGLAVPAIALPILLSPVAYVLGQIFVVTEANYVRVVSVAFIVGSFLSYSAAPGLSILLVMLAYLVLASGMLKQ